MQTVTSKDGTKIAYDKVGQRAPQSSWCSEHSIQGSPEPSWPSCLASRFTVISYDRRGRGAQHRHRALCATA